MRVTTFLDRMRNVSIRYFRLADRIREAEARLKSPSSSRLDGVGSQGEHKDIGERLAAIDAMKEELRKLAAARANLKPTANAIIDRMRCPALILAIDYFLAGEELRGRTTYQRRKFYETLEALDEECEVTASGIFRRKLNKT